MSFHDAIRRVLPPPANLVEKDEAMTVLAELDRRGAIRSGASRWMNSGDFDDMLKERGQSSPWTTLTALLPADRHAIYDEGFQNEIACDIGEVLGLREDLSVLCGTGIAGEDLGLMKGVLFDAASPDAAIALIRERASEMQSPTIIGHPELGDLLKIVISEIATVETTQIPFPPAEPHHFEADAVLVDSARWTISDRRMFELDVSTQASYFDGMEWRSAYQQGQVLVRITLQHAHFYDGSPTVVRFLGRPDVSLVEISG